MTADLNLTSDIIIAVITLFAGAVGFYFLTKFQLRLINEDNKDIKFELKDIQNKIEGKDKDIQATLNTLIVGQAKVETEVSYLKDEIRSYRNNGVN